jgi:hypothetical protein
MTNNRPKGSRTWLKKNPITKIKLTVKMPTASLITIFNDSVSNPSCLIWKILGKLRFSRFGRLASLSYPYL